MMCGHDARFRDTGRVGALAARLRRDAWLWIQAAVERHADFRAELFEDTEDLASFRRYIIDPSPSSMDRVQLLALATIMGRTVEIYDRLPELQGRRQGWFLRDSLAPATDGAADAATAGAAFMPVTVGHSRRRIQYEMVEPLDAAYEFVNASASAFDMASRPRPWTTDEASPDHLSDEDPVYISTTARGLLAELAHRTTSDPADTRAEVILSRAHWNWGPSGDAGYKAIIASHLRNRGRALDCDAAEVRVRAARLRLEIADWLSRTAGPS